MEETKYAEPPISRSLRYASYACATYIVLTASWDYLPFAIGGVLLAFWCGSTCATWAHRLGRRVNLAYAIGFFGGLPALVGYGVFYKRSRV